MLFLVQITRKYSTVADAETAEKALSMAHNVSMDKWSSTWGSTEVSKIKLESTVELP